MKRLLTVVILVFACSQLRAQDWIVINSGDTIKCKILSVDNTLLHYIETQDTTSTTIPIELVNRYEIFVPHSKSDFHPDPLEDLIVASKREGNKNKGLRLDLRFGYTYMLAPIAESSSQQINEYRKKSKSGVNFHLSMTYFFGSYFGLGPRYSFVHLRGKSDPFGGFFSSYYYQHDIQMHYVGLQLCSRFATKDNSFRLLPGVSIGYMKYRALAGHNRLRSPEYQNARTFGTSANLNADIRLFRGLYLGFDLEFLLSSINESNYYGEIEGSENNLTRMDLGIGIRYYMQAEY